MLRGRDQWREESGSCGSCGPCLRGHPGCCRHQGCEAAGLRGRGSLRVNAPWGGSQLKLVYLMGNIPSVKPFGSTHCILLGDIHSFGDVFLLNNFCCFFHFLNSLPKHGDPVHGPVGQVNSRRAV